METAQYTWRTWYSPPVPADLSYVNVSDIDVIQLLHGVHAATATV